MQKLLANSIIGLVFVLRASGEFQDANEKCKDQTRFFEDALKNQRIWAMEFYDTWAKFQHGILSGNVKNFGDFDRCENFVHVTTTSKIETIRGKYCLVAYTSVVNFTGEDFNRDDKWREASMLAQSREYSLESGICFPKSCSHDKDVQIIADYFLSPFDLNVTSVSCKSNDLIPFRIRLLAVVIFLALLLTVVGCTIYELYMNHREKTPCMTLVAFSAYTNGRNLFDMTTTETSKSIECLNGLRALSLLWIIYGHRFFDMFLAPATNYEWATENWLKNIFSLSHTTFHLAVDTFFLMGGLLVTWSLMKSFDAKQFNVLKIYFHRYLRYTPVLLFLQFFFVSFVPYLGTGPNYDRTVDNWMPNCYKYWWTTLLHIATYTNIDNLCMNWTWYLSADFQLFLFSPVLVYPAWRYRWKFFAAFPLVVLFSMLYILLVSKSFEFMVFVGPLQSIGQYDYDRLIYYPTHARCGPWFVGMMLGFVMYQYRNNKPEINRSLSRFLWVLSISLLFLVVLGYFPFQQADRYLKISNAVNASYNALYRTCWAIGLAWIIFACHNGSGGIIRWFLCLPHFKPLARMSLSVYLSHRVYQIVSVASMRQPIHLRPLALLHLFFGDVIISIIVGTLVYLCIEAPTAVLEARLFKRKKLIN